MSVCLCGYVVYVYVYVYVVFVSVCERVLACLLEVSKKSDDSRLPVLAGYTGARCEVALTGCQSLPCQHGATCQSGNGTGTFLCLCSTGFTGKHQLYCQSGTGTSVSVLRGSQVNTSFIVSLAPAPTHSSVSFLRGSQVNAGIIAWRCQWCSG